MAEHEFTYQELIEKGKANSMLAFTIRFRDIRTGQRIPVLQDGEVIWTATPTTEQIEDWRWMMSGMAYVTGQFHVDTTINHKYQAFESHVAGEPGELLIMPNGVYSAKATADVERERENEPAAAKKHWGLDQKFPLVSTAALFYLLYTRHLREDRAASEELQYLTDSILPDIKNYLDMAAGGEARHMASRGYPYNKGRADMKEYEEEAFASGLVDVDGSFKLRMLQKGKPIKVLEGSSRPYAWGRWKSLREEMGIIALDWCIMVHMTIEAGSYGGPLWASCAKLVREHELGRRSDIFFIDQAFSLQHNGGIIFNKLWNCSGLAQVLDAAFQGKAYELPHYLNQEHKVIYNKICHEVTKYDSERTEGHIQIVKTLAKFDKSTVLKLQPDYKVEV